MSSSPHLATKLCRDCSLHNADSKASDKQMYTPYFVSLVNLYLRFFIINLFPDMILTSTKMNQDWVHRQDSLQIHIWRQFTDKTIHRHSFEDSSPTELKTVQRQNWRQFAKNFYIIWDNISCYRFCRPDYLPWILTTLATYLLKSVASITQKSIQTFK